MLRRYAHKWKKARLFLEYISRISSFVYVYTKKTGRKYSSKYVDYLQVMNSEYYFIHFYTFWSFYTQKIYFDHRVFRKYSGVKSVHGSWGASPAPHRKAPWRCGVHCALAHTQPSRSASTCTKGQQHRGFAAPGSWGPQRAARSWEQWCCAGVARSPGRSARRGTAAGPERGPPTPSRRRRGADGGRCRAGSGTPSTLPHRPCAAGHTYR